MISPIMRREKKNMITSAVFIKYAKDKNFDNDSYMFLYTLRIFYSALHIAGTLYKMKMKVVSV